MNKLMLSPRRWYGWQFIETDSAAPFNASPIFLNEVTPLKTGHGYLELDFIRVVSSPRAVHECFSVKVRCQTPGAVIGSVIGLKGEERLVAITPISLGWVKQHCSDVWRRFPPSLSSAFWGNEPDPQDYLRKFLGGTVEEILSGVQASSFDVAKPTMSPLSGVAEFEREWSGMDAWLILRGCFPYEMEHKWFIYADYCKGGGTLNFRRSWTGLLVYQVPFVWRGDGIATKRVRVNLNSADRKFGTREQEVVALSRCISGYLLADPQDLLWGAGIEEVDSFECLAEWFPAPQQQCPSAFTYGDPPAPETDLFGNPPIDREPALTDFALHDPEQRKGFLNRLTELDAPGLMPAVAHLWSSLGRPKGQRATLMGAAAGVGGKGKKALWNLLSRVIEDVNAIETPPLPRVEDYPSEERWHAAVFSHFSRIDAALQAVLEHYSAVMGADAPGADPRGSTVVQGPWVRCTTGSSKARRGRRSYASELPWLNTISSVRAIVDGFRAGVLERLGRLDEDEFFEPFSNAGDRLLPWLCQECLRMNGLFFSGELRGSNAYAVEPWSIPERLGAWLVKNLSLGCEPDTAVREAFMRLASEIVATVEFASPTGPLDAWEWQLDGLSEGYTGVLLGIPLEYDMDYTDEQTPANGGPGVRVN